MKMKYNKLVWSTLKIMRNPIVVTMGSRTIGFIKLASYSEIIENKNIFVNIVCIMNSEEVQQSVKNYE